MRVLHCVALLALLSGLSGCGDGNGDSESKSKEGAATTTNSGKNPSTAVVRNDGDGGRGATNAQNCNDESQRVESRSGEKDDTLGNSKNADDQSRESQNELSNENIEGTETEKTVVSRATPALPSAIYVPELKLSPRAEQGEWDVASRFHLNHNSKGRVQVAFSPDGDQFASLGVDGFVKIWDARTGRKSKSVQIYNDLYFPILTIQYTPSGKYLTVCAEHDFCLLNTTNWKIAQRFKVPLRKVEVSRDGKQLAVWGPYSVAFRELPSGRKLKEIDFLNLDSPVGVPDGRSIIVEDDDHTLAIYDPATGRKGRKFVGHQEGVRDAAISRDGKLLARAGGDRILVWEMATGKIVQSFSEFIILLDFVDNETVIAQNSDTLLLDIKSGEKIAGLPWSRANSFAVSPKQHWIVTGGRDDGHVKVADLFRSREQRVFVTGDNEVRAVAWSPDGKVLATSGTDKVIRLWDTETGKIVRALGGDESADVQERLVFSPDGARLISLGGKKSFGYIWDLSADRPTPSALEYGTEYDLSFHRDRDAVFLPDGKVIACGVKHEGSYIFGVGGDTTREFSGHADEVSSLAIDPAGRFLFSGSYGDDTARLWDLSNNKELLKLTADGNLLAVAISPDAKTLATAENRLDGSYVRLWDTSGELRHTLPLGRAKRPKALAFTLDGSSIIAGCEDGWIRIWNVSDGQQLCEERAHKYRLTDLAVYGPWIATVGYDLGVEEFVGKAKIWNVDRILKRARPIPDAHD